MIASETLLVDAAPLAKLFNKEVARLGGKATYLQKLELIYTDGKADAAWHGTNALNESGLLVDSQERRVTRTFYAKALIDFSHATISVDTPNRHVIKQNLMRTVCHEYIHALQNWRMGATQSLNDRGLSRADREYRALDAAYQAAKTRHPSGNPASDAMWAYQNHPWEKEAFRLSIQVVDKIGPDIRAGTYDRLLPLKMIDAAMKLGGPRIGHP